MMVFAGRLVCRWKYVGDEGPEDPMLMGPAGNDGVELLVNCLRLHTAIGDEQASVVLERLPCRNDATRWARRGRLRRAMCVTSMSLVSASYRD